MFFVLLEVCVDEEAARGVNKSVLYVVHTLVPAWRQRGCSCGDLEEGKRGGCVSVCVCTVSVCLWFMCVWEGPCVCLFGCECVSGCVCECTNPCEVQVAIEKASAESGDPRKNCSPNDVISYSPGKRERERG